MSKKFYQSPFYHLRTLSNTILPPTKMSNVMSKNAQSHYKSSKTIFAVRGSHLPTLPKAKTKVRGSQFAPSLFPLPLHKSSRFAVRTFSLSTALTQKFAVRSSHLLFLSTALSKSSQFAVRTSLYLSPLSHLKSSQFAVRTLSFSYLPKLKSSQFAVRSSHRSDLLCPNSKVRGSRLAATHFPDNPTS